MVDSIRVVAPATLQEGFTFEVLLDGKPYTVVVPEGGVKEGQEFEVPFYQHPSDAGSTTHSTLEIPSDEEVEAATAALNEFDAIGTPIGRWRTTLCSCCDVATQATPWMACCCIPVFLGQLLARMRLSWQGLPTTRDEASLSFNRIVMGYIAVLSVSSIPTFGSIAEIVFIVVLLYFVGARIRRHFRRKYRIPATCCHEPLDDICCVCFCGCCSFIQMARHTHNDKEYPGYCCTTTGLDIRAPEVPDDDV